MIKANLYKDNSNLVYSTVRMELPPGKIIFHFKHKSFSIPYSEIVTHAVNKNRVRLEILSARDNLVIHVSPIKSAQLGVLTEHLRTLGGSGKNSAEVTNPMYTE